MGDHRPLFFSVLDAGNDGGDGNDPHGQEAPADQAVEKGTLPRLELPQDGDIDEGILVDQGAADIGGTFEREDLQGITDLLDDIQYLPGRRLDQMNILGHGFH